MGLIKGMPVILYERIRAGTDDFGAPIWSDQVVTVENVLVSPMSSEDIISSTQIYGKHGVYQLGIPKGDTHQWQDASVEFFGRKWRTFGFVVEGIEANIPGDWHRKVKVEAYE